MLYTFPVPFTISWWSFLRQHIDIWHNYIQFPQTWVPSSPLTFPKQFQLQIQDHHPLSLLIVYYELGPLIWWTGEWFCVWILLPPLVLSCVVSLLFGGSGGGRFLFAGTGIDPVIIADTGTCCNGAVGLVDISPPKFSYKLSGP